MSLNEKSEGNSVIQIKRTSSAPSVLSTSSAQDRYNRPRVVKSLHNMQHGKCCYCEGYIPDDGRGKEVEHFRPRSKFPQLAYDWNNLLLACTACNGAKSDQFPTSPSGDPLLLDPSDPAFDPEDHVSFVVREVGALGRGSPVSPETTLGLAIPKDGSPLGKETIRTTKLYQSHHVRNRKDTLRSLRRCYLGLLGEIKKASNGEGNASKVETLKNELRDFVGGDRAYASLARAFVRQHRLARLGIHPSP